MNINAVHPVSFRRLRQVLAALSRAMSAASAPDTTMRLQRGRVLTINRRFAARRLVVRRGSVWVTDTPATKDFVLEADESLNLTGRHPFVIEALSDAEIILSC